MNKKKFAVLALLLISLIILPLIFRNLVFAAASPSLGTAASYSILAGSAVTNTGSTTIGGNVGISPGAGGSPNYTGFGPGANSVTLGGVIHDADGAALTAMGNKNAAYAALGSQGCNTTYAGTKDLAGETLVPGVYCANSFHLTGTLTLNGSASDVWIFKSASDLIISGGSSAKVVFTDGGQPCNVWWRVVSTATFDAGSSLVGNILADTSITFAAGASLDGRALARTAEVTLSSNSITGPTCQSASPTPTVTPTGTPASTPSATPTSTPTATPIPAGSSSSSNGGGLSQPSAPVCEASVPGTPTILSAVQHGTSVTLTWSAVPTATYYSIVYGTGSGYQYGVVNTGNVTSYTINDLTPGVAYHYAINAVNNCMPGNQGVFNKSRQVLGASTMAGTGSFEENLYLAIMVIGGAITSFGLKNFKKDHRLAK